MRIPSEPTHGVNAAADPPFAAHVALRRERRRTPAAAARRGGALPLMSPPWLQPGVRRDRRAGGPPHRTSAPLALTVLPGTTARAPAALCRTRDDGVRRARRKPRCRLADRVIGAHRATCSRVRRRPVAVTSARSHRSRARSDRRRRRAAAPVRRLQGATRTPTTTIGAVNAAAPPLAARARTSPRRPAPPIECLFQTYTRSTTSDLHEDGRLLVSKCSRHGI